MLRIGCVKYFNARPLIRGWPGDVEFDTPSALCQRLAKGQLDVALVSSFEFLRNPIYQIVNDVSISSDGPVYSVVVAHSGEFSNIEEVELDPASLTSVNLLGCLLAERRLEPRLIVNIDLQSAGPAPHRARLLIGDQAIRFRQKHAGEFHFWDLGEQWKELTGLPFVYALWLIRPEVADAQRVADHLRAVRNENLASLDELIETAVARIADPGSPKITREFLGRYYREHLGFSFGEKEKNGLRKFANLCAKYGMLRGRDPVFSVI